eukprot:6476088-Amphidinium_carterae.1
MDQTGPCFTKIHTMSSQNHTTLTLNNSASEEALLQQPLQALSSAKNDILTASSDSAGQTGNFEPVQVFDSFVLEPRSRDALRT